LPKSTFQSHILVDLQKKWYATSHNTHPPTHPNHEASEEATSTTNVRQNLIPTHTYQQSPPNDS